ncbi:MAG TPA: NAD(P)/FAD-dependent oxidoreductase [Chloroflexaceae bacterium]|nr:NAD(P)/FAD-dependent oxidoreductase [Chloroflexaceae bacterium]
MTAETGQGVATRPRVVIIGAGFGGLEAARRLADHALDVLVLDKNNYHGFWPLLYQVATAELDASHIAQPVRQLLRDKPNLRFRVGAVRAIDRERRLVVTDRRSYPYDELIVAAGSVSNFFGLDAIQAHGFDLKDLPETLALRNQLLGCFERAAEEDDPERRRRMLTFAIVGGGPTGVELAGAIAEMVQHVLRKDFPDVDFGQVRIVLIEMADRLLLPFAPSLAQKAQRFLARMGVEFRFNTGVVGYEGGELRFKDGSSLPADTVIWAAGVQGSPVGKALGVELQRGARVRVLPTLQLPESPDVWVIGDLAYLEGAGGKPYPQLATVAMQQGRWVAANLLRKRRDEPLRPFRYTDKGSMATVGRHSAVAHAFGLNWSGPVAWLIWLVVHVYYLIGFRNRLMVLFSWAYNYFTYDRSTRAILTISKDPPTLPADAPAQIGERALGAAPDRPPLPREG